MPISFSITDGAGTASLTIADGSQNLQSSYLLDGFPRPYPFTTTVEQVIAGNPQTNGVQADGLLKWVDVGALLSEEDFYLLELIAHKGEKARQDANNPRITFNDEFYYYTENTPRTRALASGSEITIGSGTGGIRYYAQYNVVITNISGHQTNRRVNGLNAFEVTFTIEELDKTTP